MGERIEMLFPFLAAYIAGSFAIPPPLSQRHWMSWITYMFPSNVNLDFQWFSLFVFYFVWMFCFILRYLAGPCGFLDSNSTMFSVGVFRNNLTQFAFLTK